MDLDFVRLEKWCIMWFERLYIQICR